MQEIVLNNFKKNMKYRRVGQSGLWISEISLGTWLNFNSSEKAKELIRTSFENGINHIDTADLYGQLPGWAEFFLGEELKEYRRSSYVLSTKVYSQTGRTINEKGLSRKHIFEACNSSLKRLKTDYIDLYYCHRYDPSVTVEEVMDTMADLKKQGKILYVGISMWPSEKIEEAIYWAKHKNVQLIANQVEYNLLRQPNENVLDVCQENGIGLIAYSPLAQGCLTGKYKSTEEFDARRFRSGQNRWINKLLSENGNEIRLEKYMTMLEKYNVNGIEVAIKWLLERNNVSAALCGARSKEQLLQIIEHYNLIDQCYVEWVNDI